VKFILVDRISELETGRRIVAHKALSLAEEYLGDHFPAFPVLPGVLMLEALVQASAWVVREGLEFAPSLVLLKEARNVSYKSFVAPGQVLTIESDCKELAAEQSVFAARGTVEGREIVKGKLTLRHLNLADNDPRLAEVDEVIRTRMRALFDLARVGRPAGVAVGERISLA
jgi:3-hydroxyacyl-[acyl-carrier-protein] dehydratase